MEIEQSFNNVIECERRLMESRQKELEDGIAEAIECERKFTASTGIRMRSPDYVPIDYTSTVLSYYTRVMHMNNPKFIDNAKYREMNGNYNILNADKEIIICIRGIHVERYIYEILILAAIERVTIHFALINVPIDDNQKFIDFVVKYNRFKNYII